MNGGKKTGGRIRLKTATDVRRGLQKVANMVLTGDVEPQKANCFGYLCNIILQSLRVDELESEISELQQYVQDKKDEGRK